MSLIQVLWLLLPAILQYGDKFIFEDYPYRKIQFFQNKFIAFVKIILHVLCNLNEHVKISRLKRHVMKEDINGLFCSLKASQLAVTTFSLSWIISRECFVPIHSASWSRNSTSYLFYSHVLCIKMFGLSDNLLYNVYMMIQKYFIGSWKQLRYD